MSQDATPPRKATVEAMMDTNNGRIYGPDEFARRKEAIDLGQALDEHQAEFERLMTEGGIVPVSDRVAVQQLRGQASEAKRRARKAAKAARKRNRS